MKFEFVRTPEFNENIREIKKIFKYLSNPINLLSCIIGLGFWFGVYVMILILADTYKGY